MHLLMRTMLPPSPEDLRKICERGFKDAFRFILENKLIYCDWCIENDRIQRRYRIRDPKTGKLVANVRKVKCVDCAVRMHNVPRVDISLPNDMRQLFETASDAANTRYSTKLFSAIALPVTTTISVARFSYNTFQSVLSPVSSILSAFDDLLPEPAENPLQDLEDNDMCS